MLRAWLAARCGAPAAYSGVGCARDGVPNRPSGASAGRVLRVGPGEPVASIAAASRLARDGDTVEIKAGDYHGDVAQWEQTDLTIRGVGGMVRLFADGKAHGGKAIWVMGRKGSNFRVSNIAFVGARVPDRNGAGIRFEGGKLVVRNCLFWGNENGLLAGASVGTSLHIEDSEFGYNGNGDGLTHNLYGGAIDLLKVSGSYFHHANVGHLLKSRARVNEIIYNRLTDETGGRASYELDFPNGGLAVVMGNIIQKGPDAENSAVMSYGREGISWDRNELVFVSNTVVNDH
ncbi:MAG: hypothetical protein RLZZ126_974, partial [Pseudomonadota bacterium]